MFLATHPRSAAMSQLFEKGFLELRAEHFNEMQVADAVARTMFKQPSRLPPACRRPEGDGFNYYHWTSKITDKGLQAGLSPTGGSIPVRRRTLIAITGLLDNGDRTVTADFNWQFVPTQNARHLGLAESTDVRGGQAILARYDDGWRLARIAPVD